MFSLDRLRQPCIVRPKFEFQRAALYREALLQSFQTGLLVRVERDAVVQHIMQLGTGLGGLGKQGTPDEYSTDGRNKCSQRNKGRPETNIHGAPINKVDGASGELGPNGVSVGTAYAGAAGRPAPTKPIIIAAPIVAAPNPNPVRTAGWAAIRASTRASR